jgi:beta-N-acetylhexosaminidase
MKMADIEQKVAQLMVFGFHGKAPSAGIKELIRQNHVGGIILFSRNMGTKEEIIKLNQELQKEAKEAGHPYPLFICVDQEHGVVRRLEGGTTVFPGAMVLGATGDPNVAYDTALATAKELKALGFNWNFAPSVDINNNPFNPIIGTRSYSDDASIVSTFGIAAMKGMQAAGVITSLKHFPGHGDTTFDSHVDLPIVPHNMERLVEIEFKPFQEGIEAGADSIMSAHVCFPSIEERINCPATLSSSAMTGILREQMRFDGVVISDNMEMNAISSTIGTARGAVEAIKAGVDMIIVSHQADVQLEVIHAVSEAVKQVEISKDRFEEALDRVTKLKTKYLSWGDDSYTASLQERISVIGCPPHQEMAEEAFRKGITIVKNEGNLLPLNRNQGNRALVVYPELIYWMLDEKKDSVYEWGDAVREIDPHAVTMKINNPPTDAEIEHVLDQAKSFDTIIVGTVTSSPCTQQQNMVQRLYEQGKKLVIVAMRSPYDLAYFPKIPVYIAAYEASVPALRMAARAIYGLENVSGKLPVKLPQNPSST